MALLFHLYFLVGSVSGYRYDSNAFLFSLVNKPGWAPVKLPQTGKYSSRRKHSIDDNPSYGPTFGGGHDIHISNYASSQFISTHRNSYSNLGYTYSPPSGYSYGSTFAETFLAGTYHAVHTRGNRNVLRNNASEIILMSYNRLLCLSNRLVIFLCIMITVTK